MGRGVASAFGLLLLAASLPAAGVAPEVRPFSWSITPYLWVVDTTFKLRADGSPVGTGRVDFGDLMDTLDGAFQGIAERRFAGGRWSAFVDLTYLETSESEVSDLAGLGSLRFDTDSRQVYADAAIAWWPWPEVSGFNVYGGVRYTDLDDRTRVDAFDPVTSRLGVIRFDRDFTDALIGMRDSFNLHRFGLPENLSLGIRLDYGFGDSDGVLLGQGALRWAFGRERRHGLVFGYRYKEATFKSDSLKEEYEYEGPVIGLNLRF